MRYDFYAYMDRMKYIKRWQLMRSTREENIMEHSQLVAMLAHALVSVHNGVYGGNADVLKTVLYATYHICNSQCCRSQDDRREDKRYDCTYRQSIAKR